MDQTVCSSSPQVSLAGAVGGGAASGTWSGGTGTFSPGATTLNAIYTPSAAEIAAGGVTLFLTTNDPAGPCPALVAQMRITIQIFSRLHDSGGDSVALEKHHDLVWRTLDCPRLNQSIEVSRVR